MRQARDGGGTVTTALPAALTRRHIPVLDGLRAVSVFTVMAYHFGASSVPGDLGVTAFFVLSGFLITRLLLADTMRRGASPFRGSTFGGRSGSSLRTICSSRCRLPSTALEAMRGRLGYPAPPWHMA